MLSIFQHADVSRLDPIDRIRTFVRCRGSHENLHPEATRSKAVSNRNQVANRYVRFRTREVTRSLTIVMSLWYVLACDRVNGQ